MKERGTLNREFKKWTRRPTEDFSTLSDAISIGYENAFLPFTIMAFGITGAIGFVVMEVMKSKLHVKKLKSEFLN
jgi:hypothetical protein